MVDRFWPKSDMDVAPDGPFVRYSELEALRAELEAVKRERDAAHRNFIDAWEALPGGHYTGDRIERWLIEYMKPAVDRARAFTEKPGATATGEPIVTKLPMSAPDPFDGTIGDYTVKNGRFP